MSEIHGEQQLKVCLLVVCTRLYILNTPWKDYCKV